MSNVAVQEALKAAIDFIEEGYGEAERKQALALCKAALSEIEKCEPVAYCNSEQLADMKFKRQSCNVWHKKYDGCDIELYDKPQPIEWVELTDEQKNYIRYHHPTDLVNATEAKCKQLNTKG